jgi:pimeloyl-ACP methyl ester carboxylesterase
MITAAQAPHDAAGAIASVETGPPEAPLIVLIHGAMDRMAGLHKLARRLDGRYRVLRYDRRGYGASATHAGPYDINGQVDDLVSLLHGRPALIVGHSYGGAVALTVAERHADLVSAVVVFEPPQPWQPWWPADTAGEAAVNAAAGEAAETFMRRLIGNRAWERLPEATKTARRAEGAALVGELRDLRRGSPFDPARIRQAVIAGCGELGRPHHRRGSAELAAVLANVEVVELAGCHHGAPSSHPDLFTEKLVVPALRALGYE